MGNGSAGLVDVGVMHDGDAGTGTTVEDLQDL